MKRFCIIVALCLAIGGAGSETGHAADSTSFNPVPVSVKSTGGIPVGTVVAWPVAVNPSDMSNWLECNGQAIDGAKYPALRALVGANTPNYQDRFLRGGTAGQAGQIMADSLGSHAHGIDQHQHSVSGVATDLGSYKSVEFQNTWTAIDFYIPTHVGSEFGLSVFEVDRSPNYMGYDSVTESPSRAGPIYKGFRKDGDYWLNTTFFIPISVTHGDSWTPIGNRPVNGWTDAQGPTSTHASGSSETAPMHTRVRYFIRALP